MILKLLSVTISILGQKTSKTMLSEKILGVGRKRQKDDFSKKKLHFEIWAWNIYNQSSKNQQVNLIARAKLGSHLRPRSVQFFNILGIIKNKLWDHRIVWWFCSQIFFAHFGASFASSSASATPKVRDANTHWFWSLLVIFESVSFLLDMFTLWRC